MEYKVITPIKHNGQLYGPSSTIELDEVKGAYLVGEGVVEDPNAPKEKKGDDLSRRVLAAKNGTETKEDAPAETTSTDTANAEAVVDETVNTDTKPGASDAMTRPVLEAIALEEGSTQEMIDACGNKAELVSLIEAARQPQEQIDPSAEL